VVLHREWHTTKQMLQDQLACKVKYVCIKIRIVLGINVTIMFLINKTRLRGSIMINLYENAYIFYVWSRIFDPRIKGVAQKPKTQCEEWR
jgi:hypothetical protein